MKGDIARLDSQMQDLRTELKGEFTELRAQFQESRSETRGQFRWTMSLVLMNWLSVMAAIFLALRR